MKNKGMNNLMKLCLGFLVVCSAFSVVGCSSSPDKANCLTFATSYSEIIPSTVVFGIYKPNQSTMHAWVKREDGTCMDQMRIFQCDDSRYKALSEPSVDDILKLMGDRV